MKRKLGIIVTALALVAVMLVGLCACGSAWSKIKSAYEKEGYHEVELSDKIKDAFGITDEDIEEQKATIHIMCTVTLSEDPTLSELKSLATAKTAIIAEYKNLDDLKAYYKDSLSDSDKEKFDELWEKFQAQDQVNDNCLLLSGDKEIFKGTK